MPSETVARFDSTWGDSLLGDKAHCAIFDNSKIRGIVPGFAAEIPFAEGAREIVAWYNANPSMQTIDSAYDEQRWIVSLPRKRPFTRVIPGWLAGQPSYLDNRFSGSTFPRSSFSFSLPTIAARVILTGDESIPLGFRQVLSRIIRYLYERVQGHRWFDQIAPQFVVGRRADLRAGLPVLAGQQHHRRSRYARRARREIASFTSDTTSITSGWKYSTRLFRVVNI